MAKRSHTHNKPIEIVPKFEISISDLVDEASPTTFSGLDSIEGTSENYEITRATSAKDWDETTGKLTAPVRLPLRNSLTVDLVPYELVNKLDEYRGDIAIFSALFWSVVGATLSIIYEILSSNLQKISNSSITMLVALGILGIFSLIFYIKNWCRAKKKLIEIKDFRLT